MTTQCVVRAALTEERSKAETKNSALRCRDETKSCYRFPLRASLIAEPSSSNMTYAPFVVLGFFHHFPVKKCLLKKLFPTLLTSFF